jgi:hypothetical protein
MKQLLIPRPQFLTAGAAGLGAALAAPGIAADAPTTRADVFSEPSRDLPVNADAAVMVCGAGPAGVTA